LEHQFGSAHLVIELDEMRVLHHLMGLLLSRYKTVHMRHHICDQLGIADLAWAPGRVNFESRPPNERHFLIQLSAWLLLDLEPRLRQAWLNKAVRYNNLLKDFDRVPGFYAEVVEGFSDWRRR
jgi:hypothetical protein